MSRTSINLNTKDLAAFHTYIYVCIRLHIFLHPERDLSHNYATFKWFGITLLFIKIASNWLLMILGHFKCAFQNDKHLLRTFSKNTEIAILFVV